jgi:hypothetical protein
MQLLIMLFHCYNKVRRQIGADKRVLQGRSTSSRYTKKARMKMHMKAHIKAPKKQRIQPDAQATLRKIDAIESAMALEFFPNEARPDIGKSLILQNERHNMGRRHMFRAPGATSAPASDPT